MGAEWNRGSDKADSAAVESVRAEAEADADAERARCTDAPAAQQPSLPASSARVPPSRTGEE